MMDGNRSLPLDVDMLQYCASKRFSGDISNALIEY